MGLGQLHLSSKEVTQKSQKEVVLEGACLMDDVTTADGALTLIHLLGLLGGDRCPGQPTRCRRRRGKQMRN